MSLSFASSSPKQPFLHHRLHHSQEGPDPFLQAPFVPHSCSATLRRGNCPQAGKTTQGGLFNLWRRAISSINRVQLRQKAEPQHSRSQWTLARAAGPSLLWLSLVAQLLQEHGKTCRSFVCPASSPAWTSDCTLTLSRTGKVFKWQIPPWESSLC